MPEDKINVSKHFPQVPFDMTHIKWVGRTVSVLQYRSYGAKKTFERVNHMGNMCHIKHRLA